MSLILEALRKSEAERRRGQVPDLHAGPAPGAAPLRDELPTWLWLALAIATAIVLAIALWLARSAPPLPSPAADVPVAEAGLPMDSSGDSAGDAKLRDEASRSDGASDLPGDRPSAGALPALTPPPGDHADAAPIPGAPSASAASTGPATANAAGAAAAASAPAPVASPPPAPAAAATPARTPAPDAALPRSPTAAPVAAPASSPLRLSDLGVAQRQQLPPLKMSMHMYSPTQRFAIIDGSRVAQGDRIGDAVVEEITADGVVLNWQGQRLQIPLP